MTRKFTLFTLVLAFAFALLATSLPVLATPEMADAEAMKCTVCHDKPGSKLMTDQGKYYELMGTMDGFDEIEQAFTECTACHVKKPGSKKLTRQGKKFYSSVKDMEGLRDWLDTNHPKKGEEPPETD